MTVNAAVIDEIIFFFFSRFAVNLDEAQLSFRTHLNLSVNKVITS